MLPSLELVEECRAVFDPLASLFVDISQFDFCRNHPETYEKGLREWPYFEVYSGWCNQLSNFR